MGEIFHIEKPLHLYSRSDWNHSYCNIYKSNKELSFITVDEYQDAIVVNNICKDCIKEIELNKKNPSTYHTPRTPYEDQ